MNFVTVPTEILAIDQTLEPDMYSGIYNFTVYIALLRHEPLLLASVLGFRVRLNEISENGRFFLSEAMEATVINDKVAS